MVNLTQPRCNQVPRNLFAPHPQMSRPLSKGHAYQQQQALASGENLSIDWTASGVPLSKAVLPSTANPSHRTLFQASPQRLPLREARQEPWSGTIHRQQVQLNNTPSMKFQPKPRMVTRIMQPQKR
mmetsp:Transcript_896/g.1987  ORF Transcript_896/g.1987 Transcript_896/m.1987 type:complete len:126 (+) Transcript_896:69-446(+)